MEFQVINRNRNAVIPEGMFKLCGMEDAKLISMVQLNGGILLMPESVSTYQLLMLIDALNEQACEFLEAVAAECGPAEAEHRDMTLDEVLREFTVAVPDWAREKAGITADTKLDCEASEDAGVIAVYPASYRHDLTDVPRSILQCLLASGHSLYALNDILTAESENSDAEYEDDPSSGCIRFLTETECERLMGLPEGWTKYGADGREICSTNRYTALGNAIALPCAEYIMAGIADALGK